MQAQNGAKNGKDGDDGDDGSNGIDAPFDGIVLQILSNSTSEYDTTVYAFPHTLLSININVSANSDIYCVGTINLGVYGTPGEAAIRLWLDNSIMLANISVVNNNNIFWGSYTLQGLYEDLSEGEHTIELQYGLVYGSNPLFFLNRENTISVLTVMELA